jgi:hypothetical protein
MLDLAGVSVGSAPSVPASIGDKEPGTLQAHHVIPYR